MAPVNKWLHRAPPCRELYRIIITQLDSTFVNNNVNGRHFGAGVNCRPVMAIV